MSGRTVYLMIFVIVLIGVLGVSTNVHKVEAPYPIIFIRADGSFDPSTANITSLDNVTYTFTADINASIIVEKDNIIVDGAGYILQGTGIGTGIDLTGRSNVTIKNMEVKGFFTGIHLWHCSNNTISGNNITANGKYGIRLYEDCDYTTIYENNIKNNDRGIDIEDGRHTIYHNNFIGNNKHVNALVYSTNTWDNGVEGNYWSNYTGVDLLDGGDGIGDSSHVIDANNQDNYPLIGPISFFNAGTWEEVTYYVHTVSNSTVSDFIFSENDRLVSFNVTGSDTTAGFCRVGIPKELLYSPDPGSWVIRVNGTSVSPFRVQENGDYAYIYFTYSHSTQNVQIFGTEAIPEFSTLTSMLLLLILLTVAIAITKRRLLKTPTH